MQPCVRLKELPVNKTKENKPSHTLPALRGRLQNSLSSLFVLRFLHCFAFGPVIFDCVRALAPQSPPLCLTPALSDVSLEQLCHNHLVLFFRIASVY